MHKIARIIKIHSTLLTPQEPMSAQQWSRLLGVNVRTVLRDFAFLRDELKAPLEFDPSSKGYRYTRANFDFMSENKLSKWGRWLTLIHKIYAEPGKTAKELADLTDCSERTIFRDIDELGMVGFPVYSEGGYRFAADGFLPALHLSPAELFALFVSVSLLESQGAESLAAESRSGLEKLLRGTSETRRLDLGMLGQMLQVSQVNENTGAAFLGSLQSVLTEGCQILMTYQGMKDEEPQVRRLDPMGLFCFRQVWYLHAYDHQRAGLRNFRLSRVSKIVPLPDKVVNEVKLELDAASYHRWDLEGNEKVPVRMKVTESLGRWLLENPAHPSQSIDEDIVHFTVTDPEAMAPWLMSLHGYEVLEPEQLRKALAASGRELWERYRASGE